MRFTVLGSGTTVPDAQRGPAGFLLQVDGRSWLVDGGTGTLQRCMRAGVDPRTLDGGIYSHRHPDHCADLVPLLFAMKVGPPRRTRDYPIWAGEGFAHYLQQLRGVYGKWIALDGETLVHELPLDGPGEATLAPGVVLRTAPANHSAGALHLRFEAHGASVVFSGDTGPSPALTTLATGADLLVCECATTAHDPHPTHLHAEQVREIVEGARPRQVWLTHFYPEVDVDEAVEHVGRSGIPVVRAQDADLWEHPPT